METRMLRDIEVSKVGMGCMAFSHGYGKIPPERYSIEAIQDAYDHGCTFFDTAEVYSPNLSGIGHNELIVGKALSPMRDDVVIATKLMLRSSFGRNVYKTVRKHLEGSLQRLQADYVDVYYLHRMGGVPVEDVADAMGRLIDEGLIRGWVPQLSKTNIAGNQPIVDLLAEYARLKGATSAQVSLAWMLHKFGNVVPIPGSKTKEHIIENLDAAYVELSDSEFSALEAALDACTVYGHRGLGGF